MNVKNENSVLPLTRIRVVFEYSNNFYFFV